MRPRDPGEKGRQVSGLRAAQMPAEPLLVRRRDGWEFDLLLLVSSLALWALGGGGLGPDAVLGGGG